MLPPDWVVGRKNEGAHERGGRGGKVVSVEI